MRANEQQNIICKIFTDCGLEKGENIIDGKSQPVSIRTTTVFRKEDGRWKVIGHHTDTLAYLKKLILLTKERKKIYLKEQPIFFCFIIYDLDAIKFILSSC